MDRILSTMMSAVHYTMTRRNTMSSESQKKAGPPAPQNNKLEIGVVPYCYHGNSSGTTGRGMQVNGDPEEFTCGECNARVTLRVELREW